MSKKDYILLANALKDSKPTNASLLETLQWEQICRTIAKALQDDNDRFNYPKFIAACNKTG